MEDVCRIIFAESRETDILPPPAPVPKVVKPGIGHRGRVELDVRDAEVLVDCGIKGMRNSTVESICSELAGSCERAVLVDSRGLFFGFLWATARGDRTMRIVATS